MIFFVLFSFCGKVLSFILFITRSKRNNHISWKWITRIQILKVFFFLISHTTNTHEKGNNRTVILAGMSKYWG